MGYGPLAVAHAFSALTGSDTVQEALAELREHARLDRIVPIALEFDVVERDAGLPQGHSLTITGVERGGRGIRVTYEILPSLSPLPRLPRVETRDDCDERSAGLGGSIGELVQGPRLTVGAAGTRSADHCLKRPPRPSSAITQMR